MSAERPDDNPDLWRDFMRVVGEDDVLFDPLAHAVEHQLRHHAPLPDGFESWEDVYESSPSALAYSLLGSASILTNGHESIQRNKLLNAALRISETLPLISHTLEASRGAVLQSVFWQRFRRQEYEECAALIADVTDYCGDAAYVMSDALQDPTGFIERSKQRSTEDD